MAEPGMRMRDLEKASGINRETIRFYIREGLLPEPVRTSRNSAIYGDMHLQRLLAIRRLRDDRYLPLGVIRTLIDTPPAEGWDSPAILPHVDRLLRARLDRHGDRERALDVLAEHERPEEELAQLIELGAINVAGDGTVSARDARILRILNDLNRLGFSAEHGYDIRAIGRYLEAIRWLADMQAREFVANTGRHAGDVQAAEMAERGVGLLIELIGELFVRELLSRLDSRAAGTVSELPGKGEGEA
jgi:DNA-binding transcriptional MerR regulator